LEGAKLDFTLVALSQVTWAILKIKSNAVGADQISAQFLKLILPHILSYITDIFNLSITYGSFPSIWKLAMVRPFLKLARGNRFPFNKYLV